MYKKIEHFIKYNNAIPIFFGILFLGAGGALAANEDVRDAVISSENIVRSIDNTRIVNVDLNSYSVAVEIIGVEEDDLFYYVEYTLYTVDLVDGVWTDMGKDKVLKVSKESLKGKDLGLYATRELAQVRDGELNRLKETQEIERGNGESIKVVATVYSGLVGKFLDTKEEFLPGYNAVIKEVVPPPTTTSSTQTPTTNNTVVGDPSDTEPPVITILGNNPAKITRNSEYSDLGAYVYDNKSDNLGYKTFIDGIEVFVVQIDTSTTTTYTITYRAVDQVGNIGEASRIVEVYDPNAIIETPVATTTPPIATTTPPVVEEPEPIIEEPATTTPLVTEELVATTTPPIEEPEPVVEEPATTTPSE